MTRMTCRFVIVAIAFQCSLAGLVQASRSISLDQAVIVVEADDPPFVRHAAENLAGYLEEATGRSIPVNTTAPAGTSTLIAVGVDAAKSAGASVSTAGLGEEGYVLGSEGKQPQILVAAGEKPRGTMRAVYALMKLVKVEGGRATIETPLSVRGTPAFATRGMHFNGWPFKYPHSFRRWSEQDWQRYLDILAVQGVNLFFFWPFMEIIPTPLSPEDQKYLEECRRIIDYAQTQCGMQVWIMQCTNRVARDNCGVTDPKARPYWRPSQEDLKPQIPEQLQAILASREVLYRALNNVDGVCNIDSDPGYCPDCPLEGYLQALNGFRSLLDRYNLHGNQARLMNWMWMGWGKTPRGNMFDLDHQDRTLGLLKEQLRPPWGPVPGRFDFLDLCRKNGLLAQSVLLQYGLIEDEPSYPRTNVGIKHIFDIMERDYARNRDLPGAIGNVQTPLLQLPHIYTFTSCLWDMDYLKRSESDVLSEVAECLYPDHRQLVADCYAALRDTDPDRISGLANQLDELVRTDRLGRLGIMGRKLFPNPQVVAEALVLQLRLRAAHERLMQDGLSSSSPADCVALLRDCLDAYLAWDLTHGWHDFWGWNNIPLVPVSTDPRYGAAIMHLARRLETRDAIDQCIKEVATALNAKYDPKIVQQGCIEPLAQAIQNVKLNLACWATATASVVPDPKRYPPSAANDGQLTTQYWPGALVADNKEWLQLTWDRPQKLSRVVAQFLQHPSMPGRTIHLQHESASGQWEDLATAVIPADTTAPHAVATFKLASPVVESKLRIVNLLDLYEIEVE